MKFEVRNRFSGDLQFVAEIECSEDAPASLKLGLSVKWAIKAGADLARAYLARADLTDAYLTGADLTGADLTGANFARAYLAGADLTGANLARAYLVGANLARANFADADLTGANLAGADLTGANLARANLIDSGQRSDGYRFVGWVKEGKLMIRAGCRNFDMQQARDHWQRTRGGTPLGNETFVILDHIEKAAAIRGLTPKPDET
jgi:pentapeptide repeat protein